MVRATDQEMIVTKKIDCSSQEQSFPRIGRFHYMSQSTQWVRRQKVSRLWIDSPA